MRTLKAGDLRHTVTLLEPVVTMEGNRRRVTWAEHPVKAGKKDVSGREFFEAQAYHAEDTVTFTVRYREDVTAAWRLRHRTEVYDIAEV